MSKTLEVKTKILIAAVSVFDFLMLLLTGTAVIRTAWITYVIVFVFMIVRILISQYNYRTILTKDIEKGMILSQVESISLQIFPHKNLPGISDESLKSRLTAEEAEGIREWGKSKDGRAELCIVRKIPFAVFIFCGLLAYLIIKGCIG